MTMEEINQPDNGSHESSVLYANIWIKDIASVRLTNALIGAGIYTLEELLSFIKQRPIEDLLKIRNLGKNSLEEVHTILNDYVYKNRTEDCHMENITTRSPRHNNYNGDTKITDIGSPRLANALSSIGIRTIEQLVLYAEYHNIDSLLSIKNFGRHSLQELSRILNKAKSYISTIGNSDSSQEGINTSDTNVTIIPQIPLNKLWSNFDIVGQLGVLNIHTTSDLYTVLCKSGIVDLCRINTYDSDVAKRIMGIISILQDRDRWQELQDMIIGAEGKKFSLVPVMCANEGIFKNIEEECLSDVSHLVQQYYISNTELLSVRAQHVIKSQMPEFGDLLIYSALYSDNYKNIRNCGIKTWGEINLFAANICREIRNIANMSSEDSKVVMALSNVGYKCTSSEEYDFISDFYAHNKHIPMLYILANHIKNSDNRFEKLYRSVYGILCQPTNARTVAKQCGLTYERVRQLLARHNFENVMVTHKLFWAQYLLDAVFYLSQRSELFVNQRNKERLEEMSFVGFGYMLNLVKPLVHLTVKANHYFFAQRLLDCFDVKSALTDIENTLSKKVAKDTEIPIAIFIDSYWINAPTFEPIEVVKMLCEIISDNFEVKIDDNYRITIFQNTIDVSSELHDIINANGDSMNIDDIFVAFKEKYPEHKYREASQLRPYLAKDERICPIGKTSCYTLLKWDTFTGTLKDLIYNTLLDSEAPLTAEDICEIIHETYDTSPKSIRSTVVSDKSGKFIFFKKGYIGVNTKEYSSVYENLKFADRRHRQSFEDSLNEYEEYLRTHHHMPLSTGTEDEQFLYRWYNNVVNRCMTITLEREVAFNAMVARNADYMVNGTEYSFYRRCDEYKAFLDENMELPTMETDTVLYRWFHNNIKIYMEFDDRRKDYFEDLLEFIQSYGFFVH